MMPAYVMKRSTRAGFTLIEAAMGSIVVAVLLGAGLTAVTQATKARKITENRAFAQAFAQQIIEEVASKAYVDPQESSPPLGLDPGEVASNRESYDDCDDYASLEMRPISLETGEAISDATWSAKVRVYWVHASDFSVTRTSETGLKCIEVAIYKNGARLLETKALRSSAWEDMQ